MSDTLALGSFIVSIFAFLISVYSAWYTRRSHLATTVPRVSVWIDTGGYAYDNTISIWLTDKNQKVWKTVTYGAIYIANNSLDVAATNVLIRVKFTLVNGKSKYESKLPTFTRRLLEPKEERNISLLGTKKNDQDQDITKNFEEFLAEYNLDLDEICKLAVPERSKVIDAIKINMSLNIEFSPSVYGGNVYKINKYYNIIPVIYESSLGEDKFLTWRWKFREKQRGIIQSIVFFR